MVREITVHSCNKPYNYKAALSDRYKPPLIPSPISLFLSSYPLTPFISAAGNKTHTHSLKGGVEEKTLKPTL